LKQGLKPPPWNESTLCWGPGREMGIEDVVGLDGPWTETEKLLIPKGLFHAIDLSSNIDLKRKFDLVISLEVGEHLEEETAPRFVENLIRHGDVILFGAAIPLQGGFRHLNEKWQSYWRRLFESRGYRAFDVVRPVFWNDAEIHYWYRQNCLLYVSESNEQVLASALELSRGVYDSTAPLDLVHPEKYHMMVSYEAIELRRLFPKLPKAVFLAVRRKLTRR
jgi:hypothetical protein